ncbi:MAG: hypothetical protein ABIS01_10060 [Ferruginibacter sp.]
MVSDQSVKAYYEAINATNYSSFVDALLFYKEQYKLDDWLYYQLIRKTIQQISPKEENYQRYTVYKYFLLTKSGYAATLKVGNGRLLFYVQTEDQIFNLPYYMRYGRQYVCLNYHDYKPLNFENESFTEVSMIDPEGKKAFTYKVTRLPDFKPGNYVEKDLRFNYWQNDYHFKIKMNSQIKTIFANYPVVDYESYFNIPLSKETYQSLIPLLKTNVKGLSTKSGVDFLMHFTRYAFLFETDMKIFGEEKRLSPEQTLIYDQSDCEDRAALFFYLVKEIYNLPMIVLAFPTHVTIALKLNKPVGKPIFYKGTQYSICEPTPQREDLNIGKLLPSLHKIAYEIVYAYNPDKN